MAPTQYDKEDIDRPLVGDDRGFFDHPDIQKMHEDHHFKKWGDELNEGSEKPKEKDSEELENDEEAGGEAIEETSDEQSSIESLNEQDDGTYFFDEEKGKYGRRSSLKFSFGKKRRRNLILISLASGLFVGTMGLSILSGPFQLIQIANLLRGFSFGDQENITNNRLGKIAKYIRYSETPENTRLSYLQRNLADRMETKMNDAGIKSNYNKDLRGALAGYDIDVTKFDDPELKRLMDPSTVNQLDFDALEQRYTSIQDHVKTTYGLDLDLNNGFDLNSRTVRTTTNTGYFSNKKLLKNFIKKSGYSSLGGMRARIGLKKAGVTLHPIRKVDDAIKQRGLDFVKKHVADKRAERIKNGADTVSGRPVTADAETDANGNSTVDPQADEVAKNAADVSSVPVDADTPGAKKAAIKSKVGKAAGITAIAGVVCAVKGIADNIDEINQARIVLPLARYSGELMATGMQIMGAGVEAAASIAVGEKPTIDIDLQQIQIASELLASDEFGSWFDSTEVQAALGKDSPGREIPPEARIDPDGNAVSQFLGAVPGLETFCDVLNSTFGFLATTLIDIGSGPFGFLVGEAAGRIFGPPILNGIVSSLASEEVDLSLGGTTVGSYGMHGGKHAANMSLISSAGAALSPEQTVAWQEAHNQDILDQYKEGGFFAQFLNPLDARTSVGSIVAQSSSSPADNIALMFKTSMKGVASMINPTNLFGAKAKAAEIPYDYGFDIYSFGIDTLEDPRYEIPQENSRLALELLNGPSGSDYIKRSKDCFGIKIDGQGTVKSEGQAPSYSSIAKSGSSCTDSSEGWTRIRFHIFDNQTAGAAVCYEGDECADFEFDGGVETSNGGGDSGPTTQDLPDFADTSPCPINPDIAPAGTGTALRNGAEVSFTLCRVLDTATVNVVYANNFLGLFKNARAAGHDLGAGGGSYLSMDGALARWRDRCGDRPISDGYAKPPCVGNQIAPPGSSNHEIGLAVDLTCNGATLGGGTTTRDQFDTNDPCVSWVRSNSREFGLILQCDRVRSDGTQSAKCESWHISPTGG